MPKLNPITITPAESARLEDAAQVLRELAVRYTVANPGRDAAFAVTVRTETRYDHGLYPYPKEAKVMFKAGEPFGWFNDGEGATMSDALGTFFFKTDPEIKRAKAKQLRAEASSLERQARRLARGKLSPI